MTYRIVPYIVEKAINIPAEVCYTSNESENLPVFGSKERESLLLVGIFRAFLVSSRLFVCESVSHEGLCYYTSVMSYPGSRVPPLLWYGR